jgi:hypothetical protein
MSKRKHLERAARLRADADAAHAESKGADSSYREAQRLRSAADGEYAKAGVRTCPDGTPFGPDVEKAKD